MLRAAREAERETIRRWRNHPQVRAASFTDHEIGADEHRVWWRRVAADPSRALLVYCERDGDAELPAGVVLFEDLRTEAGQRTGSWGFYLDVEGVEARGTGLSSWLGVQRAALDHAFEVLRLDLLSGEVLEHNTAVRRGNRRFGFVEGPPAVRTVAGHTVRYRRIGLRRDQRRGATSTASHGTGRTAAAHTVSPEENA